MTSFIYNKLSPTSTSIRLLRILPAQPSSPEAQISAKLYTFPFSPGLKGCPPFAAISYTWSSPSQPTIPIKVNDSILHAHPTVHELLLTLRDSRKEYPLQPHFIWIDSICIDQDDAEERNHHGKMMGEVYSSAERVLVWLGSADRGSDKAMDYLKSLKTEELERIGRSVMEQVRFGGRGQEVDESVGGRRRINFDDMEVERTSQGQLRENVAALLRRVYWGRILMVQEALLAKKVAVLCGRKRIAWSRLKCLIEESQISDLFLLLDDSSLASLGHHFDRLMVHISHELNRLVEESSIVTLEVEDAQGRTIDNVDVEIARFQDILRRVDALEMDFDRIVQIRDIVRGFRTRAEELEAMIDMGMG